ncbi:MAG: VWA domain-containing protein [Prevotellaceae bacterium]|jgi:Ca-activated chloride channel family protein|nr:VWA domain-containing protein [Prevotellaceae bacterium]
MSFHNSEYLFLLLLLVPLVAWYLWKMRKSDASMQISALRGLEQFPKSVRIKILSLPFILRCLAIASLIVAIARPQLSSAWNSRNAEGIDIMIVTDISSTMLGEDLSPNRLEAAKKVATDFINSRPNDNIGLVVFARESFTQCPMTTNHTALINLLYSVNYGLIKDGTAIGLGLANGVSKIKEGKAKSKVIILLTDGSNNAGDIAPATAAELAKTFGIRVYTIGVGTFGKVNLRLPTPAGMRTFQMESEFDEETLKNIATLTGGRYFHATNNAKLKSIYKEIDELEKTKFQVENFSKRTEIFYLFASLALVFIVLEFILRRIILKRMP